MPSGRCPHCKRDTVYQHVSTQAPLTGSDAPKYFKQGFKNGLLALARCGHQDCKSIVYRELNPSNEEVQYDMYPPIELDVEDEMPPTLQKSWGEALATFANGHWNSSAQASRRALQDAMKLLKPEGTKPENWAQRGLKTQIEILVQQRVLMPQIGDWAQEGRMVGVLGAHGAESAEDWWADEQDAGEALEFTKWVLRYIFVLPEQLRRRRERLAQESSEPASQ